MPLIQPKWTTEPTTLYVVSYFATNAINTNPFFVDPVMYDLPTAQAKAKEYITSNNNEGVCTLQETSCFIVYPATSWVDF